MYYNPETKESLSKEALQNLLNASFPEGTLLIDGWHLIDENTLYPHLLEGQFVEQTGLVFEQNKWCRTYAVRTTSESKGSESTTEDIIKTQAEKIVLLEKAVEDLAQMVSNLEEYNRFGKKENIVDESTEE
jgi:hypothetical protein